MGGNSVTLPASAQALSATAVKTSAYTASPGDLVPVDATSAGVTITLPSTPADKSRVTIKKIDSTANAVTIQTGGSDVLNKTGGSTTASLTLQNQAIALQYASTGSIWYVVGDDIPLSSLTTSLSATYVTKESLVINVKDYGAKGDGSTDDTAAISSVLAALISGSTIFFPAGNCILSSDVSLPRYVSLCGTGSTATQLSSTNSTSVTIKTTGSSSTQWQPTIDGFYFNNVRLGYGFTLNDYANGATIRNCDFAHTTSAAIEYQNNAWLTRIENCRFYLNVVDVYFNFNGVVNSGANMIIDSCAMFNGSGTANIMITGAP